ncbi:MAG: ABC transporter ATP-binding protein [Candidimonas sp.]|nr:MAG: ABC transporter ATP-binding protein [Candidimonas sp.]TAM23572.1 MAG: ABC transporter ATP-binding protein [Candidimonas sp.]TAM77291.1 MAG: ABC transporter ATP-binding protein [Candidimonas sp.]
MNNVLELDNVSAFYGASQILQSLNLKVEQGKVTCLLGLNGMGKTTTLRAIMGLVDRVEGRITLNGEPLVGRTHLRARMGVTLVPEDRKVFASLTVHENMAVAQKLTGSSKDFLIEDAVQLFPRLQERLEQKAGTLSGGEQQMLVVARALLANPSYILLDEPTEGLAPDYVDAIKESIQAARERNIGIILVEQSLPLALAVGDEFYIIENGQMVFNELRDAVTADPVMLEKMLTVE